LPPNLPRLDVKTDLRPEQARPNVEKLPAAYHAPRRSPLPAHRVAAAILSGEMPRSVSAPFPAVIGSGEWIGQLLGSARTEDDYVIAGSPESK